MVAIENLTATTLRNIIGEMELDQCAHEPRHHQRQDALYSRRSDRPLGHQGQPRGAQEHSAAARDPERDGKADEGRARTPRGHSRGPRARSSPPILDGRGRKGVRPFSARTRRSRQPILEAEGRAPAAILKAVQKRGHPERAEGARRLRQDAQRGRPHRSGACKINARWKLSNRRRRRSRPRRSSSRARFRASPVSQRASSNP